MSVLTPDELAAIKARIYAIGDTPPNHSTFWGKIRASADDVPALLADNDDLRKALEAAEGNLARVEALLDERDGPLDGGEFVHVDDLRCALEGDPT